MSYCVPPGFHIHNWHTFIKFYPVCESLCVCWTLFQSLICLYEIASRLWVALCLLGFIWIFNVFMKYHPDCELLCVFWVLYKPLTCFYETSSRMWVAVHLLVFIWITNTPLWHSIQLVSCYMPSGLYLNHWYASMTSYPGCELLCAFWASLNCWYTFMASCLGCELLCTFWAFFELLICPHKILSSMWVTMCVPGFIWIAYILLSYLV